MNRRSFLKRIAAVAAGAVAVPMIAETKKLPWTRRILDEHNTHYRWCFSRMSNPFHFEPPSQPCVYPEYELGTLYKAPDGSIYRYVKMCKDGEIKYADCPRCKRVDLHDHARCTG